MKSTEVVCPLHQTSDEVVLFWQFDTQEKESYSLFKCNRCEVLFYNPFPKVNYELHTNNEESIKDYVHLNANVTGLIDNLLNYINNGSTSLLEIGCGFGFTLDFAKHILGLEVVGYEPSLYGEIGSKELNLDIQRAYFKKEDIQDKKFDIVFLSEVLEHVENIVPFMELIKTGLSANGVFILTTPDYSKLKMNIQVPSDVALLSPGAHTILFNKHSLYRILEQLGFKYISIHETGNSLLAVCSVKAPNWKVYQNKNELIRYYYNEVLERVAVDSLAYAGIFYRLFRNYIDFGDYIFAHLLTQKYTLPKIPGLHTIQGINSVESYHRSGVSCSSLLAYYMGMLNLNYHGNYTEASSLFNASFLLCSKKLEFMPDASVLEYDIIWSAKYHIALSHFNQPNYDKALATIHEIKNFNLEKHQKHIPIPEEKIIEEAKALEKRILQIREKKIK